MMVLACPDREISRGRCDRRAKPDLGDALVDLRVPLKKQETFRTGRLRDQHGEKRGENGSASHVGSLSSTPNGAVRFINSRTGHRRLRSGARPLAPAIRLILQHSRAGESR
jgi:hypothetical protein